ncbi:NAD(P)-binding domain-containing protein [Nostoc sp. CHAB 5784]|uniref:NADPH-dependent F420 reductase n=1 Tax=Nostoc mirabile TaxID=2907820 RepID=UPI001E57B3BB|nr:NAD(P)-binding domain-containing protein [Nostoc mirabile]MCC5668186.1 NAD(P)-binding domain-containing protein [Nostoc mirabile CHAB5784]
MKIGIIGSGNMGRSVGILWTERGHEVFFGSREAEKGEAHAELAGHGAKGGTNDEAAAFADVIFYGVRELPSKVFSSTEVLANKILIVITHPSQKSLHLSQLQNPSLKSLPPMYLMPT